ncbi:TIGR02285 family protein [Paucibacter sp. AS339]|uniref:TIGR02285 family protein n=1 Tax=Paucibacter hankyongi TaxID=3133434 RepID=UPI0030973012
MIPFPLFLLGSVLSLLITRPAQANTASPLPPVKSIVWLTPDATQIGQSRVGFGVADKLVKFVAAQLPAIEHSVVRANAKRSLQMLEQGEPACHASLIRSSERERIAYFSNTLLLAPMQLIVRADKVDALPRDAHGEVDLAKLLADGRLRGALTDRRSYGDYIDAIIAARPDNRAVVSHSHGDFGGKLLQMLQADRADYLIDYPTSMDLMLSKAPESSQETLRSLPIQGASELVVGGVACPRNAWGLAAITSIDRALGTPAGVAMLRESSDRLLRPEARRVCAARQDAFYKERARPSKSF